MITLVNKIVFTFCIMHYPHGISFTSSSCLQYVQTRLCGACFGCVIAVLTFFSIPMHLCQFWHTLHWFICTVFKLYLTNNLSLVFRIYSLLCPHQNSFQTIIRQFLNLEPSLDSEKCGQYESVIYVLDLKMKTQRGHKLKL